MKYFFIVKLPWVDFQVVVAGYCVNLNFLLWGSLETKNRNRDATDANCRFWLKDWGRCVDRLHAVRHLCIGQGGGGVSDCISLFALSPRRSGALCAVSPLQLHTAPSADTWCGSSSPRLMDRTPASVGSRHIEPETNIYKDAVTRFSGHSWQCFWSKVLLCPASW